MKSSGGPAGKMERMLPQAFCDQWKTASSFNPKATPLKLKQVNRFVVRGTT
jgi:hypothetical protein